MTNYLENRMRMVEIGGGGVLDLDLECGTVLGPLFPSNSYINVLETVCKCELFPYVDKNIIKGRLY